MGDKYWKLMVAMFIIVASQAVLFVGMMMGGDSAGWIGMISLVGGLIGLMVGIVMGVSTIVMARGSRGIEE